LNPGVEAAQTHRAIRAAYQVEAPHLLAALVRLVRDVGLAEELAQDALLAALEQWPESGIPDNPGAWLMSAARNRGINALKRTKLLERKHEELALLERVREQRAPDVEGAIDANVGDDLLRLILIACHPVLPIEGRVALTLRLLCGLTTEEIARAFLVPEPTIAQRIVRAKRTLAEARVAFEVPWGTDLAQRLASVLGVVYLVFNEGYSATAGEDLIRPELCTDALRLGRIMTRLAPDEPEVHGLLALMELNASRAAARVDAAGEPVLLLEQDRGLWDPLAVERGLASLARAEGAAGARGTYALQAAIAACHARARVAEDTDWARIAELYDAPSASCRRRSCA
jgi:RNA polymerase sigma factor (sigma-70 family)